MNLLAPLPRTKTGSRFIFVMADRNSKVTRANSTKKTTATNVTHILVGDWAESFGISERVLTDIGPHFPGKFFDAIWARLATILMTTTAYYPQTSGQTERYNKTILSQLHHYINEQHDAWDTFIQLQTYSCNARTHAAIKSTPFCLALTREPPEAFGLPCPSHNSSHVEESMPSKELRSTLLNRIGLIQTIAVKEASLAQQEYKTSFDKHIKRVPTFEKDGPVYLDKNALAKSAKAKETL